MSALARNSCRGQGWARARSKVRAGAHGCYKAGWQNQQSSREVKLQVYYFVTGQ